MHDECVYTYAHVNVCACTVCLHGVCTGCMGVCVRAWCVCISLCVCAWSVSTYGVCVCAFVGRITAKKAEGTSSPTWFSSLPSRSCHS